MSFLITQDGTAIASDPPSTARDGQGSAAASEGPSSAENEVDQISAPFETPHPSSSEAAPRLPTASAANATDKMAAPNFRAKAGDEANGAMAAAPDDPVSRDGKMSEHEPRLPSEITRAGKHGGRNLVSAERDHAPNSVSAKPFSSQVLAENAGRVGAYSSGTCLSEARS